MASPTVTATKNGRTRTFNEYQWNLLGKNKEGWVRTTDIVVDATNTPVPPTGEKKKTVKEMKVEGSEDAKKADSIDNGEKEIKVKGDVVSEEQKAEFMLAITGLTKSTIKNFFDKVQQAYDNKSNANELKTQLAEYFKYDIEKYNTDFTA